VQINQFFIPVMAHPPRKLLDRVRDVMRLKLRHDQKIQHKQGFAEVNDWSKIVQPPESGQSMSMLTKTLQ